MKLKEVQQGVRVSYRGNPSHLGTIVSNEHRSVRVVWDGTGLGWCDISQLVITGEATADQLATALQKVAAFEQRQQLYRDKREADRLAADQRLAELFKRVGR